MARETSGEKAAVQSLTSQMEEARQREKDLQDRILAMEGWPILTVHMHVQCFIQKFWQGGAK